MSSAFTFNARYALVTYAQCDGLDPWDIVDHFTSLEAECIIGRENHADGGTHYHAFADFGKKRRFRRANCFDVGGYHPNISPSRKTPGDGFDYAIKEGDVVAGGLERPNNGGGGRDGVGANDTTMGILVGIESERDFWIAVREMAPGLLLRNFPSLKQYASWRYQPAELEYESPSGIHFDTSDIPELTEWASSNIGGHVASGVR